MRPHLNYAAYHLAQELLTPVDSTWPALTVIQSSTGQFFYLEIIASDLVL